MPKLCEMLENYKNKKTVRMHMPGHKGNGDDNGYNAAYDITEITDFDNLHGAEGILKESMEKAAKLWKSEESFYLINGSTCGILAGIRALTKKGDTVICARNCHKSVFNAIELCALNAQFIMPEYVDEYAIFGKITPESIEDALRKNPDAKLVVVTSPTYEGMISDMAEICRIAHNFGAAVLADEAHGAHLELSPFFTGGSVRAGCDIVVQSLHKTLSCPTQTAILHVNGQICDRVRLRRQLSIFETSSPSYLFMNAIDSFVNNITDELFENWNNAVENFYNRTAKLEKLRLLDGKQILRDKSKIVVFTDKTDVSGYVLAQRLRQEYNIEVEMASEEYIIAMTGSGDTAENLSIFADALIETDAKLKRAEKEEKQNIYALPQIKLPLYTAAEKEVQPIGTDDAAGKICGEFVWAYPPGIPVLMPGEEISGMTADLLKKGKSRLHSDYGMLPEKIMIIKDLERK